MTITQFDEQGFTVGMRVKYDGNEFDLVSVDFQEKLIAINEFGDDEEPTWKRCENIDII